MSEVESQLLRNIEDTSLIASVSLPIYQFGFGSVARLQKQDQARASPSCVIPADLQKVGLS